MFLEFQAKYICTYLISDWYQRLARKANKSKLQGRFIENKPGRLIKWFALIH